MSRELPRPTAEGDLARTPFAHALLYCHQRGLTGTLVVWPEHPDQTAGQDRVRLEGGVPVAARLVTRAAALDRGLLPLFARRGGPYAFYADLDLVGEGEAVRTGRVDPLVLIAASLRGSSRDDAVDAVLAAFGSAPMRLKPGSELKRFELLPKELAFVDVVRAAPASIDELASLCELGPRIGRRLLYLLAVTKMLEPFEGTLPASAPRRSPSDPLRDPSRTPATPVSATPVPATPVPAAPVPAAMPASPARPADSRDADDLEFVAPGTAPAPGPASPQAAHPARPMGASLPPSSRSAFELERAPAPPPSLSREHAALWSELAARAEAIDTQSYFEMLDIPRDTGSEGVRRAYFAQVKRWHPDRVPAELAPLKPFVDRVFQHLTEAHDTLCDEKRRGNYMRVLSDGGGTPESERKLAAIVQAAMDQQKAEVLLRRRDVDGAIALLEGSLELSPDDADAHALYAWALFSSPSPRDPARMMQEIDRALALNEKSDRAHYYRGMILRRLGRDAEAITALERAAELNPKNVDAVREVRIARMRGTSTATVPPSRGSSPRPSDGGGLLSKLFGSKKPK